MSNQISDEVMLSAVLVFMDKEAMDDEEHDERRGNF